MHTCPTITFLKASLILISVAILGPPAIASDAPENFQVVDGIEIYLGIVPAQILHGHPKEHQEAKMHKGVPSGAHRDHVVVALFDAATGERIENAKVTSSVMEFGLGTQRKKLEPMEIAGTTTYGNYFKMPDTNTYHIKLWVLLPDRSDTIEAKFTHAHFVN